MPEHIARAYMFHLSSTVASRRDLTKGTNDPASWCISSYVDEAANFDEWLLTDDADGYFSALLFDQVLPMNISSVPMKKIVEFSASRRDERNNLRQLIDGYVTQLAKCSADDMRDVLVADFVFDVERGIEDYRKSRSFLNSNVTYTLLSVGVPVAATAWGSLALAGNPFSVAKISGAIAIGAVAAYADYKRVQAHQDASYASYLIDIRAIASKWRDLVGRRGSRCPSRS